LRESAATDDAAASECAAQLQQDSSADSTENSPSILQHAQRLATPQELQHRRPGEAAHEEAGRLLHEHAARQMEAAAVAPSLLCSRLASDRRSEAPLRAQTPKALRMTHDTDDSEHTVRNAQLSVCQLPVIQYEHQHEQQHEAATHATARSPAHFFFSLFRCAPKHNRCFFCTILQFERSSYL
jgi:hypothetical protein